MKLRSAALLLAFLLFWPVAHAQEPPSPEERAAAFVNSLKPQKGDVALPGGVAALKLGERFLYLTPEDSKRLIEEAWGNPPGSGDGVLGMILPANVGPLSPESWGVIITYADDGHVSDEDADKIDYAGLLEQMKKTSARINEERQKQGFPPVTLAGWAEPPHYDKATHKIYWAKDLTFGDGASHTLNYCIRVLGRSGVLELNAVADMSQLDRIRTAMKEVVGLADFTQGNAYSDFNADTDKVAAYGLAALVAGGLAAKTGLFAKLLPLLLAAKKFGVLIVAGIAAAIGKLFKKEPVTPGPVQPG